MVQLHSPQFFNLLEASFSPSDHVMEPVEIRAIRPDDNEALASVIRNTLEEFGANHPGTVYFDKTTYALYELFGQPCAQYFVAVIDNEIVGGAGIYPTSGLPAGCCELVKMYLRPEGRGKGIGQLLIDKCIETAGHFGFDKMYLETMPELKKAVSIYERYGFTQLKAPLGNTGHFGCDIWMLKDL
jgi:putative acetyltransferase